MLKRDITYEDYNGETVTDTFYFNMTKTEIIDLELSYDGGLQATLQKIIDSEDIKSIIKEFKKIILLAYGEKSEDGKRFIKNDKIREEFSQTAAYDALFMDLSTNENSAASFIRGIIPADMSREFDNVVAPSLNTPPLPPVIEG